MRNRKEGGLGGGALGRAIERLQAIFPRKSPSWIRRALKRMGDVEAVDEGRGLYLVRGRRELGDFMAQYQVFYSKDVGRWYCTCYRNRFGARRAEEVCTHVAAVMLYRRYRIQLTRLSEAGVLYICTVEIECKGRVFVKELSDGGEREVVAFKVKPRRAVLTDWGPLHVIAASRTPEVLICCKTREGVTCGRAACEETTPGEAAAALEE